VKPNIVTRNTSAFQIFAQLELQHKKRGTAFSKPAPDAHSYTNIALISALEFLESLRDK